EGSEEIGKHPDFQKYKGKVDLIFTSPPYFNREAYSEDENQSYKKYGSSYDSWRDGFLLPTLKTCVETLKPGRYLLWNVADVLVSGKYLPIEQDSIDILESFGMIHRYTLKMGLEGMPGQNRVGEDGKPKCKNYCMIDEKYMKYEPVFVFWKPHE
ncbi:TPA: site-specific DNA-methyltransferase, partial [Candidatus Woesearchaeota archaeon]|nr:site-specific DNA-methyltransferase [Candidatus Woesearchaeota archaeon]